MGVGGWCDVPMPGRPTNCDKSRARAYCACSRCGWDCLDIFPLSNHFSLLSPSLCETTRHRLKYRLKGEFSPNQPAYQPTHIVCFFSIMYDVEFGATMHMVCLMYV